MGTIFLTLQDCLQNKYFNICKSLKTVTGTSYFIHGLSLVAANGATLHCGTWASHQGSFSCFRAQAVGTGASIVAAHMLSSWGSWALKCMLSSCGTRTLLLCIMWNLPVLRIKPTFLELEGGFPIYCNTREVLLDFLIKNTYLRIYGKHDYGTQCFI